MEIQNNQLHLGGLSAEALRTNFGSPLYVYEEDSLRSQCRRLLNCFEDYINSKDCSYTLQ